MKKTIGWLAIALSIFSLAPSIVPGAMSLMGLALGLFALVLAVFSVSKGNKKFFVITLTVVLIGILVANDMLRLWGSISGVPLQFKLATYGVSLFVLSVCSIAALRLSRKTKK